MHFPVGWDPYFRDFMTLLEVYQYPTQHYMHHRKQLTLSNVKPIPAVESSESAPAAARAGPGLVRPQQPADRD